MGTRRAHGEVWAREEVSAAAQGAELRRRAFQRLEAEKPRRKKGSRAAQQRSEVEKAAAYYAAHEASIPSQLLSRTLPRKAAVSAPEAALAKSESLPDRLRASVSGAAATAATAATAAAAAARSPPKARAELWSPPAAGELAPRRFSEAARGGSRRSVAAVVPADAFCDVVLGYLAPSPRVLAALERELSKDVAAWLVPATDYHWKRLFAGGAVLDRSRPAPYAAAFRARWEVDAAGVVVDVGLRRLRFGLPSWREPLSVPLAFDALHGTLTIEEEDDGALRGAEASSAPPLPPPPLLRQKLLLEDYRVLRVLLGHVAQALGVARDSLNVVVVRPALADGAALERAVERAIDGRRRRVKILEAGACVAAACGRGVDAVLDLGHFRASAADAAGAKAAHSRLSSAALTNYVHLLLRERQVLDSGVAFASSDLAEFAKRTVGGDHAAVCVAALGCPARGGVALEQALGEPLGKQASLADLALSAAPGASQVALVGGGAKLPGLADALRAALKATRRHLADVPGDPETAAWRGAASLSRARRS